MARVVVLSRAPISRLIVAAILLLLASTSSANICVIGKIKPLRHVCGIVVDQSAAPIPGAAVEILKDGAEIAVAQTGESGKFSFQPLAAGNYEIVVEASGFRNLRYKIVAAKPQTGCNKILRIQLALGGECDDMKLVKE